MIKLIFYLIVIIGIFLINPAYSEKLILICAEKEKKIGAYSVWVSKKPFLSKLANLKRREEVEFVFKGGADSIYSNIPAHVYIINK